MPWNSRVELRLAQILRSIRGGLFYTIISMLDDDLTTLLLSNDNDSDGDDDVDDDVYIL